MGEAFLQLNLYAYWVLVNGALDVVLWCLAPYIDDSREYGLARRLLAVTTRHAVRAWLVRREARQ